MASTICCCVPKYKIPFMETALENVAKGLYKNIVFGASVEEFKKIKESGEKIVLAVDAGISRDVLKYMCDDFQKEEDQRRVQWIYSITAGVDSYNLSNLKEELKNIPFFNAHGCFSSILAEHVIFSMGYFNRSIWRLMDQKKQKKWDQFSMIPIAGKKLGIIGYGEIGRECGLQAARCGCIVTGVKRTQPEREIDECNIRVKKATSEVISEVLKESDFILGVLPAVEDTKHFFNKNVFKQMKPSSVFINIGRGTTQNEKDLVEALKNNVIRGAAIDVCEIEPLPPSSELWSLPDEKLLLTPHCADITDDIWINTGTRFANLFKQYKETGKVVDYQVNLEKGY